MKYNNSKTLAEAVKEARVGSFPKNTSTHTAVLVSTQLSKNKFSIGVQYWMDSQIIAGKNENSDRTTATLIEKL